MAQKAKQLLEAIEPSHYQIELEPDLTNFSFRGHEVITFKLKRPSRELMFHASGLDIKLAELDGEQLKFSLNQDAQTISFDAGQSLQPGEYHLAINFSGQLEDNLHGFYRSRYLIDGEEHFLATTQFEAVHAREALICIDEPTAKAVFETTLVIDPKLTALSNTDVASETTSGGQKAVKFQPTPKMSTYLLAFLVGEFKSIEAKTKEGVLVRVQTIPGKSQFGQFALDVAIKTLSFYTDYFGIPYPLPKLDMVAVPDFASGAMENWGVVTYRESAILVDPANTSLTTKEWVAMVVAHELAHQWFGNLVTMTWWTDLWLNEGFASWIEFLAVDRLFPEWQMWTQFVSTDYAVARALDALANTHPIEVEVHHPGEIDEIFDAISYQKGASVIRMLHHYLGDSDFKKGLNDYLTKFAHANATTANLWEALELASGKPVKQLMGAWTSLSGHPLVNFKPASGKVGLTQERFFSSHGEAEAASDKTIWPVPISLMTNRGEAKENLLLDRRATDWPIDLSQYRWYKLNPEQTGFYVVNYTPAMIKQLLSPIQAKQLSAADRYGVISDANALTERGLLPSDELMRLMSSYRTEDDETVFSGVLGGLGDFSTMLQDENLYLKLMPWAIWLLEFNLARLGWEPKTGESHFDTLMRPRILGLAGKYGHQPTIAEARRRFVALQRTGELSPDLRSAVYGTVARYGTSGDYNAIYQRYLATDLDEEKRRLFSGLATFRQPELISQTLKRTLGPEVRSQDTVLYLHYVMTNRYGKEPGWKFIQNQWGELVKRYGQGGHMLERVPKSLGVFTTEAMAHEVETFFESRMLPNIVRSVKQTVEYIRTRAAWFDRDRDKIEKFLDDFQP